MPEEIEDKSSSSIPQPPEEYAGSPPQISAAPSSLEANEYDDDDGDGEDFEFQFVVRDPETGTPITADEIFCNGRIRPIYPIFNRELVDGEKTLRQPLRQLLIEEREAAAESSSSTTDDLEGVPPGTYCLWKPSSVTHSPERCRKSSSTGSSLRWRIRDLMVRRSQSDGKERLVLFSAEEKAAEGEKRKGKVKQATEVNVATAHRKYREGRSDEGTAAKGGVGYRKSFLPYKPDIVGIFANVNGISRAHHPF